MSDFGLKYERIGNLSLFSFFQSLCFVKTAKPCQRVIKFVLAHMWGVTP